MTRPCWLTDKRHGKSGIPTHESGYVTRTRFGHIFCPPTSMHLAIMGNDSTDREGDDAFSPWEAINLAFSSRNTDSQLVIMCNGIPFFLKVAEGFELDGCTVDDLYDWAAEPLFPIFHGMKPSPSPRKRSVQDFLSPETYHYKICGISEKLVAKSMAPGQNSASK
ncbi:hypothetical protein J3458_020180 [Metarhizium acridum]|uniref:uncharacterized protein n=1 Tax=Metarhizium acridum TaxID=92637 RepID=UPI001C6ABE65|nr:hypothetical protein J3458_020180 [Metarhizium acridum]